VRESPNAGLPQRWWTLLLGRPSWRGRPGPASDQPARDRLTPQERQIAMLAAGLTNKGIGQQLFLSHCTARSPAIPDLSPSSA
jgi:DNA-binding NarL/FixJ family response regulator